MGRHFEESSLLESDFIYGNVWRNSAIVIFGVKNSIVSNTKRFRKSHYRIRKLVDVLFCYDFYVLVNILKALS